MSKITPELDIKEKALDNLCDEWARDHDHLIKLCEKHGFPEKEIHGDSYGVPGIKELADLLDRKIQELTSRPLSEIFRDEETIEDGFGSEWDATCTKCGKKTMYIVRPGKVQCGNCD